MKPWRNALLCMTATFTKPCCGAKQADGKHGLLAAFQPVLLCLKRVIVPGEVSRYTSDFLPGACTEASSEKALEQPKDLNNPHGHRPAFQQEKGKQQPVSARRSATQLQLCLCSHLNQPCLAQTSLPPLRTVHRQRKQIRALHAWDAGGLRGRRPTHQDSLSWAGLIAVG